MQVKVSVGDRVRCYDGTEAVVTGMKCPSCDMFLPHENCFQLAQVDEGRWVNVEAMEVIAHVDG